VSSGRTIPAKRNALPLEMTTSPDHAQHVATLHHQMRNHYLSPKDGQIKSIRHALNLTSDNSHVALQALIKSGNDNLPLALAQTILDDSYNRPGEIQVNTALKILQAGYENIDEEENINEEAIELLHFHLEPERDPGKDIQAWEKEIDAYIQKQNADEVEEEE